MNNQEKATFDERKFYLFFVSLIVSIFLAVIVFFICLTSFWIITNGLLAFIVSSVLTLCSIPIIFCFYHFLGWIAGELIKSLATFALEKKALSENEKIIYAILFPIALPLGTLFYLSMAINNRLFKPQ